MADNTVIRTIRVRGVPEGIDELTGKLKQLASAQENVAVVSETSAKRTLSLQDAWKKQTMQLDESARSQARIASATKVADGALKEGLITQQQHAERLNLISQRYAVATQQAGKFANQTGLNRYEILNLSRQLQDVGVSLASGQSPLVVIAQQGSQLFDIFQATTGTVRGFFSQAVSWAGRFATSTAGVVTGVGAIAAAGLYAATSWSTGQREVTRALTGIGAASGVTRQEINKIAEATSSVFGLSTSEAREAATAFAATGKIYRENISLATATTKDFARAMGVDVAEATKRMAKDLQDPVAAALEWNKTLGFLDSGTLNYIRSLQSAGQHQEAQNALLTAAAPKIKEMAAQTSGLSKTWDAATNNLSNYFEQLSKRTAASISFMSGGTLFDTTTDEERLTRARSRQQSLQSVDTSSLGPRAVSAIAEESAKAAAEVKRLEDALKKAGDAAADARFAQFSLSADQATRAIIPQIEQLEKLEAALAAVRKMQAEVSERSGPPDPKLKDTETRLALQVRMTQELMQKEGRRAAAVTEVADAYKGVSVETALVLESQKNQLNVAKAVGGAARMAAEEQSRVNQLKLEGNTIEEATLIAAGERAIAQAKITAGAQEQVFQLQNQLPVLSAVTGQKQIQAQYQATINQLVRDGVPLVQATAVAEAERANSLAKVNAGVQQQTNALEDQLKMLQAKWNGESAAAAADIAYQRAKEAGASSSKAAALSEAAYRLQAEQDFQEGAKMRAQWQRQAAAEWEREAEAIRKAKAELEAYLNKAKFIPFAFSSDSQGNATFPVPAFQKKDGTFSQFNPQGYSSKEAFPWLAPPTAFDNTSFDKLLAEKGSVTGVIDSLLSGSVTTTKPGTGFSTGFGTFGGETVLDEAKLAVLNRAIQLLPKADQAAAIQREIQLLQSQPQTLAGNEMIKQLTDSLDSLKESTDTLNSTMTDVLSPFYSQDPRTSNIGYRAFAGGGIMTQWGELPINHYAGGGITRGAQVSVFGEGSTPEAYVPVPSGRIPVEMRAPANSNDRGGRPIVVNVSMTANVSGNEARRTGFQIAQEMKRRMA